MIHLVQLLEVLTNPFDFIFFDLDELSSLILLFLFLFDIQTYCP